RGGARHPRSCRPRAGNLNSKGGIPWEGGGVLVVGVDLGRHEGSTPCVDEPLSGIEKRMGSDPFSRGKGL
ncbi:hypothetical protein O0J73_19995, partial [Stenotrophomonas sp. Sm6012]|uniref:hypothetical protein n=1 Tax=Stenotrophomonas sp. Sm6012 TaxID=3002745 RepID=UPI0027E50527